MLVRKFVTSLKGYILWHRRRQNLLPAYRATFYGNQKTNLLPASKATMYGNAEEKSSLHYVLCVCVQ
jgi:hypothetical protein